MIFLHLGPPKTGTTSLQLALQNCEAIAYGGTQQPRTQDPKELSRALQYFAVGRRNESHAARAVQDALARSRGRPLVISEEMYLVDTHGVSFQTKLRRLRRVLPDPVVVSLCVRTPMGAMESLQRELEGGLPLLERFDLGSFAQSNQGRVYRYSVLKRELRRAGFERQHFFPFDQLDTLGLRDVLGPEAPNVRLSWTNANAGRKARRIRPSDFAPPIDVFPAALHPLLRQVNRLAQLRVSTRRHRPLPWLEREHRLFLRALDEGRPAP
ncbi:MAG: hypothetical protein AAF938_24345 [Myxococcota bacterium]